MPFRRTLTHSAFQLEVLAIINEKFFFIAISKSVFARLKEEYTKFISSLLANDMYVRTFINVDHNDNDFRVILLGAFRDELKSQGR